MEARIKPLIVAVVCVIIAASAAPAQQGSPAAAAGTPNDVNTAVTVSFPYVARMTGNNVYVRSGPGTNYYACGKLSKGDKITVVGSHFGWLRIVPPAGSFSWISMRYVEVDPASPDTGTVTQSAPVYVGSVYRQPLQSTRTQLTLEKGEKVKLLGESQSDYYKIAPPEGDYRWVSAEYAEPVTEEKPLPAPPPEVVEAASEVAPSPAAANVPAVVAANAPPESARLQQFYALQAELDRRRKLPLSQQNYADLKAGFQKLAQAEPPDKAARYARFALAQIKRCELAIKVGSVNELEDAQLRRARQMIAERRAKELAAIKDLGKFAVIGKLQPFMTYGRGHYRIVDENGRMLCHAIPTGPAAGLDLRKFIGRKVGLIGRIEPEPASSTAVVRFTRIVELD